MARHFPVPHQLNVARGCVGKSGLESLWRPRGASAQNTNLSASKAGQSHARRARRPSTPGTVVYEAQAYERGGNVPEVKDRETHKPEIGDVEPTPEIDDTGNPEPDIPEPDVPEPEVPEREVPEPKTPQPAPPKPA